jgi:hypothetical protein
MAALTLDATTLLLLATELLLEAALEAALAAEPELIKPEDWATASEAEARATRVTKKRIVIYVKFFFVVGGGWGEEGRKKSGTTDLYSLAWGWLSTDVTVKANNTPVRPN